MIGHVIDHVIRVRRVVKRIFGSRTRSRYARSYQRERGLTPVGARSKPVGRGSARAVARDVTGGLRSVVAATAQPAGRARKSGQENG
jgi:hypothetical protein